MLTLEITNDESYPTLEATGIARRGNYRYVVKVGKKVIDQGQVNDVERDMHYSLLVQRVANDAKQRELNRIVKL